MIYTAWGHDDWANDFHPGTDPPFDDPAAKCQWSCEADSFEEALVKYHEWQGWEPYKPMEE